MMLYGHYVDANKKTSFKFKENAYDFRLPQFFL